MMVSRIRTTLAANGLPCAEQIIQNRNGGYSWNAQTDCFVDVEEFEKLCKKADSCTDENELINILFNAVGLYHGDFLPNSAYELWVMPLSRWYRSMYTRCVNDALKVLVDTYQYRKAEELCVSALRIDPFDENLLEHYFTMLLKQGKNADALEIYKKMETMFYGVLGVDLSESLRRMYDKIKVFEIDEKTPLEVVLSEYRDVADYPGAYYCDISTFMTMYQIEARSIFRSGLTSYIVVLNTKNDQEAKDENVMTHLSAIISRSLRMGDLFTRSNANQYMILLRSISHKDCEMLINRILGQVSVKHLAKIIKTTIEEIKPIK